MVQADLLLSSCENGVLSKQTVTSSQLVSTNSSGGLTANDSMNSLSTYSLRTFHATMHNLQIV